MFSRIKKYRRLKYLAYHDSMTGLLNRNWLMDNLNILRKSKYVYFIDINNLHNINKKGHHFGDLHIKKVIADINCENLIRYAGDEFILFSDKNNLIETNKLYSVGKSEIKGDILLAISEADLNMLKYKKS